MSPLVLILVVVLLIVLFGGGYGYRRGNNVLAGGGDRPGRRHLGIFDSIYDLLGRAGRQRWLHQGVRYLGQRKSTLAARANHCDKRNDK
jgi:hypothetical protein